MAAASAIIRMQQNCVCVGGHMYHIRFLQQDGCKHQTEIRLEFIGVTALKSLFFFPDQPVYDPKITT